MRLELQSSLLRVLESSEFVPVAINGTSWLGFRRTARVRVGLPLETRPRTTGRPTSDEVAVLTRRAHIALQPLVSDFPDQPKPGPVGRRLTDLFNTWPEGSRPGVPPRTEAK